MKITLTKYQIKTIRTALYNAEQWEKSFIYAIESMEYGGKKLPSMINPSDRKAAADSRRFIVRAKKLEAYLSQIIREIA